MALFVLPRGTSNRPGARMIWLIVVVIVVLLLFGGIGYEYRDRFAAGYNGGVSLIGLLLIILVVLFLLGVLR
jgi:hypothetical protein